MRRRPLLFIAVGFVTAILIEYYVGLAAWVCIGAGSSAAFIIMQKQDRYSNRKMIAVILLFSYLSGGAAFFVQNTQLEKQQEEIMDIARLSENVCLTGKVVEIERRATDSGDSYLQIKLETDRGKVLVYCYGDNSKGDFGIIPGDSIEVSGTVSAPKGRRNPGCFDYGLYLKSQYISVIMTANRIEKLNSASEKSLLGKLFVTKESFFRELENVTDDDTSAMMRAILFGDKGELDENLLEVFQRNGTAHILAVSGLHIGIIYGFLLKLWTLTGKCTCGLICGRKDWTFLCFNMAFFGCYMVMASFSPSVVRAVIMVLLHVFSKLVNRRYDLGNAALAVMISVLIINPYMLFNVGFQMSFLAVLTLILVLPFIRHIYSGIFLASLVVQIGLGPFVVYSFNYLSIISVLVNVPVIFLAGLIVPAGLISIVLSETPLFFFSAKATQALCNILQCVNDAAEIRGVTTFLIPSPPLWMMAFYYLALLTLATEEGRLAVMRAARIGSSAWEKMKDRLLYVAKVSAVLLLISVAFAYVAGDHFDKCNLTFVDVGQGDCICIQSDGNYLVDGGGNINYNLGKNTLRSYLLKNGMSHVDAAFVTHLHTDHYKGICELCQEGMVKKLFVYEGNRINEKKIVSETGLAPENIEYICSGQTVRLGDDGIFVKQEVSMEVLWPERKSDHEYEKMLEDEEDENSMSLVFRVNFKCSSLLGSDNETSLLVTGDMGEEGEKEIMAEAGNKLESSILKVGHHGSKYSSSDAFLDEVSPDFAVIQVGKNNYGHPTPEVLERLDSREVQVYRNDTDGAVGFEIRKGVIKDVVTIIKSEN